MMTDGLVPAMDLKRWLADGSSSIRHSHHQRPPYNESERFDRWLRCLLETPSDQLVANVSTSWAMASIGGVCMPVSINDCEHHNSFVCSIYCSCVSYALSELRLLTNPVARRSTAGLIHTMAPVVRAAKLDRCVSVNNWLLTTNLYPNLSAHDLSDGLRSVTAQLISAYPQHAITFRSLNHSCNPQWIRELSAIGYQFAPSRQVYLFDGKKADFLRHQNTKWDLRLLENTHLQSVAPEHWSDEDLERIQQLYRMLYLEKYSPHNPDITVRYLKEIRDQRLLDAVAYRNRSGEFDAVVGTFTRDGVMTVPLVGYDTRQPQKFGLYRLLMASVLRKAATDRLMLNLSSGAAGFKRLRGGVGELEFTAVYTHHLPRHRRLAWQSLISLLRRVGGPLLTRYQL